LIQTCGRAARNVEGKVIMYGDVLTGSMKFAMEETLRRRKIQKTYNLKHGITPESIHKDIKPNFDYQLELPVDQPHKVAEPVSGFGDFDSSGIESAIGNLEKEMAEAAKLMEFEKAAELRDQIKALKKMMLFEL
jgi:excinuclease ABC subunit B